MYLSNTNDASCGEQQLTTAQAAEPAKTHVPTTCPVRSGHNAGILQISRKTQMIAALASACDVASEVTGRDSGDPLCGCHRAAGRLATSSTRVGDGCGCWERSEGAVGRGGRWKTSRHWREQLFIYLSPTCMQHEKTPLT